MSIRLCEPLSPVNDPWDPIQSRREFGRHVLTSVEMTVSNTCNMRCEHCAVGDTLVMQEPPLLPLDQMLRRLDEVEHLQTISITGGEPTFARSTVEQYIIPLLKYARDRGLYSQINSNITLDYDRYEAIAPWLDVMHISFNYTSAADFHEVGFARSGHHVPSAVATRMYERMMDNASKLSRAGLLLSAESMINYRTHEKIADIHRLIVEMGCQRHEVHPMYPSSFAAALPMLSKEEMFAAVEALLDARSENIWMLFGTLPFFACNGDERERALLKRLHNAPKVTVRNDPDGRNRLNVSLFTGEIYVTDFADLASFGNIEQDKLDDVFARWLGMPIASTVDCYCEAASCCGPNLLVKDMYYRDVNFRTRQAK